MMVDDDDDDDHDDCHVHVPFITFLTIVDSSTIPSIFVGGLLVGLKYSIAEPWLWSSRGAVPMVMNLALG